MRIRSNLKAALVPGTQHGQIHSLCPSPSFLRDKSGTAWEDVGTSGTERSRKAVYSLLYLLQRPAINFSKHLEYYEGNILLFGLFSKP